MDPVAAIKAKVAAHVEAERIRREARRARVFAAIAFVAQVLAGLYLAAWAAANAADRVVWDAAALAVLLFFTIRAAIRR